MRKYRDTFEEASFEQAGYQAREVFSYFLLVIALAVAILEMVVIVLSVRPPWYVVFLAVTTGAFAILSLRLLFLYLSHRLPRYMPKEKGITRFSKDLALDATIAKYLWLQGQSPPLFAIGKDYEDVEPLRAGGFQATARLKSSKWAAISDLVHLCNVAHILAKAWGKAGQNADQLKILALGISGIDAIEHTDSFYNRSIISAGGGDTNPMSTYIVEEFSKGFGGYPPLRFTIATSETIIIQTRNKRWFFSDAVGKGATPARMGLIFATRQPPNHLWLRESWNLTRRKIKLQRLLKKEPDPIRLILAGLHREGTQAACQALGQAVQGTNLIYRFSQDRNLPCAVVESGSDAKGVKLRMVDDARERELESKDLGNCTPEPKNVQTIVIIGNGLRDLPPESVNERLKCDSYLQLREACRMIDFVVRYSIKYLQNGSMIILLADSAWDNTLLQQYENATEIIALGTRKQNPFVEKLMSNNPNSEITTLYKERATELTNLYDQSGELAGAVIVRAVAIDRQDRKLALVFGNTENTQNNYIAARSTQAAILGLLQKTDGSRLAELGNIQAIFSSTVDKLYPVDSCIRQIDHST
jgi:hypothetical protein